MSNKPRKQERFLVWAKRMHEEGRFDLSAVIDYAEAHYAKYEEQGKPVTYDPLWRKITPFIKGKGRICRKMKQPDGSWFVFPMFELAEEEGEPIGAKLLTPLCPKCGDMMERRYSTARKREFFGCASFPKCRGATAAFADVTPKTTPNTGTNPVAPVTPKPPAPTKTKAEKLVEDVVALVAKAREAAESHGISLPMGYRTTSHLIKLAVLADSANEAWRLWIDGRVSEQERTKFDAAGLPAGSPKQLNEVANQPKWYGTVASVLDMGLPVMLVGAAGTGKTRFAKWYAERVGKQLQMVVGSGDMAGRELWVARRDASNGNTSNVLGPAAKAAAEGDVLLLDEIDGFDSNALLPMNAVLNGEREVSVPVLGKVKVSDELRIIGAANTNGRNKDRTYNARNRLDGAFLNRFAVVVKTVYEPAVDRKVAEEGLAAALAALEALNGSNTTSTKGAASQAA